MSTLERLRQANPVPDPERLLADSGDMEAFVRLTAERSPALVQVVPYRPQRWGAGWIVAATAAVVVLAVAAAFTLVGFAIDVQPAGPTGSDQVAYVEDAYAALNNGDVDTWTAHFALDTDPRITQSDLLAVLTAAGYRSEVVEPCASPQSDVVVCTVSETTDFFAAGGLSVTKTETFTFNDDGRITDRTSAVRSMTQPGFYVYTQAFNEWLSEAHPDVYAEIRPEIITHLPRTPEQMQRAVGFVDEFIAQSEHYPIDDD